MGPSASSKAPARARATNVPRHIAVLTSGGDAPGMNAAIRAVTRSAVDRGWVVDGVRRGFRGLIEGEFLPLDARSVGGILQLGGTMLGSARCPEFVEPAVRRLGLTALEGRGVEALVVIGGNGSQAGAYALQTDGFPVVGVASTIDNDLPGSEITIGVDTALNIALEAIDRVKTTASSHERAFLIEVMGRNCGYLALAAGLAGGAEVVVIPEVETTPEQVAEDLREAWRKGKSHALAVVAEGAALNADMLMAWFREHSERVGFDLRATVLGHVQRGGAPLAFDRLLASRLGAAAVEAIADGETGVLIGRRAAQNARTPLAEVAGRIKPPDLALLDLARALAT